MGRVEVRRTAKLYVDGAFPRSESGRSYVVTTPGGEPLGNVAQASRKDARDAVRAARGAQPRWAGASAYNRGQICYRVAEMMEGRRTQFVDEVAAGGGLDDDEAAAEVQAAIDRWVHYAGWSDKIHQVDGAANPVAGPYFNFSIPEPTGVVAALAPQASALLGLVSVIAPIVVTGNTVVVVASQQRPLPAVSLTEVLAVSDVPAGVINVLTGDTAELAPHLAAHMDVNAIDLTGAPADQAPELEEAAADNLKRVLPRQDGEPDFTTRPGPHRMLAFCETKTVWHPVGV